MGIYDRQYYHDDELPRRGGSSGPRMMTTQLIIITMVIYFVVEFFFAEPARRFFCLHADLFRGNWQIWQLLSYGFLHAGLETRSGIFHVLWNMYGLFLFGRDVELRYGRQELLRFYLVAIVVSGGAWLLIQVLTNQGGASLQGASGGVTAILVLYCFNFPQRRLLLMGIWSVPAWGLGLGYVLIDLMGALGNSSSNTAYEAHLAGAAFAFVYFSRRWNLGKFGTLPGSGRFKRQPRLKVHRPDADEKKDLAADKVLEKIRQQGEASLSKKERRILEDYSRRMRDKHQS
ncbi:MAG: rhomboid family intramembrane serine protease [Planctomycetaceae bacterium]|nr:rhomboid family intramembrane serine protease [Planctomycetaceae bacterium]MCP4815103.1 rhomboid family intramembrane serine protease [Planctomycetaceae bacterium]